MNEPITMQLEELWMVILYLVISGSIITRHRCLQSVSRLMTEVASETI